MVKSVVSNSMVAHLWANQSQACARSHNGNFSFDGPMLFSYSTMIGYMATAVDGGRVPLITDCRHSVTTQGRHINPAHRATSYKAFVVPSLRALNHEVNLASLVKRYDEAKAKFLRAINNEDADFHSWLNDCLAEARRYAESFGLEAPKRDVGRDMSEIRADHERRRAKRETPAYLAKKARSARNSRKGD